MSQPYSDEEVERYFGNPAARRAAARVGAPGSATDRAPGSARGDSPRASGGDGAGGGGGAPTRTKKEDAARMLRRVVLGLGLLMALGIAALVAFAFSLPPLSAIERPDLSRATTAYTSDGAELARYYAGENRLWAPYDSIATSVVDALVSTEDKRFYAHWGIDMQRILAVPYHVLSGNAQGGSTITMQLARNLYDIERGADGQFSRSPTRKIREMMTAVQIERRYTKREVIEMYLNTVEFGANAFGIETAAQTFFSKSAADLDVSESATLVGMLQAVSRFNPIRNPERAQRRRNIVLSLMMQEGKLSREDFDRLKDQPIATRFRSSEITKSIAPYYAMAVQAWLKEWGRRTNHDIYAEGLIVTTTLDSRMQRFAQAAVDTEMVALQAVVDHEWGKATGYSLGQDTAPYERAMKAGGVAPFGHFWATNPVLVTEYTRATPTFRGLVEGGMSETDALARLRADRAFQDSLRARRTRLEAGLVAIEPQTGHVRVWVGGRDIKTDWYDHIVTAKRQPGSTFKPFVYTVAIDNGYSPDQGIGGGRFTWRGTGSCAGVVWSPSNMGGGGYKSLRSALATSDNYVTARLITQVNPRTVALYAQRMGIQTDLFKDHPEVRPECYMSLALGTSDVNLLELTTAYATLANGGLYNPPTLVTRIEDRYGNVLYQSEAAPKEALSEETAFTVVDMMRGAIQYGTAVRMKSAPGVGTLDLAAKTGTTQGNADGWFIVMHPDLVVGSWVGFNDRRIAFRSTWWGQGAHNAMFVTRDFLVRLQGPKGQRDGVALDADLRFPDVTLDRFLEAMPASDLPDARQVERENRPPRPVARDTTPAQGRVDW